MSQRNQRLIRRAARDLRQIDPNHRDWIKTMKKGWPKRTAKQKAMARRLFSKPISDWGKPCWAEE